MQTYSITVLIKKVCHLSLIQPNGVIVQPYFYIRLIIVQYNMGSELLEIFVTRRVCFCIRDRSYPRRFNETSSGIYMYCEHQEALAKAVKEELEVRLHSSVVAEPPRCDCRTAGGIRGGDRPRGKGVEDVRLLCSKAGLEEGALSLVSSEG